MKLRAPFPWFGGKSRVADIVWERFGPVPNYVEPFAGSLAVLLGRPDAPGIETVNDLDCYLANFWRGLKHDPEGVAHWADQPVNEADLHARHQWLVNQAEFRERMKSDPEFFDVKIAGWWVWGLCCWIGSGWCAKPEWSGRIRAAWCPRGVNGAGADPSKWRKRPAMGRGGRGLTRKLPVLKSSDGVLTRQLPDISGDSGAAGRGVPASARRGLIEWMNDLAERLRRVRVCCGNWDRVLGRSPTECIGVTGVFLDPPYASDRDADIYAEDSFTVAHDVRKWALEHGDNPKLRIALCGYEGEHAMPETWQCFAWKAHGGHGMKSNGRGRANSAKERIWFSPHCLAAVHGELL